MLFRSLLLGLGLCLLAPTATPQEFASVLGGVGDFDGDGNADFYVGDGQRIVILSGQDAHTLVTLPGGTLTMLGDVNGDGRNDCALAFVGQAVAIYAGGSAELLARVVAPAGSRGFGTSVAWSKALGPTPRGALVVGAPGTSLLDADEVGAVFVIAVDGGANLLTLSGRQSGEHWGACLALRENPAAGSTTLSIAGHRGVAHHTFRGSELRAVEHVTFPAELQAIRIDVRSIAEGDRSVDFLRTIFRDASSAGPRAAVQLLSGKTGRVVREWDGSEFGALTQPLLARSAGDINGDGVVDVLISNSQWEEHSGLGAGKLVVYSGKNDEALYVRKGEDNCGVGIRMDGFGSAIASLGDLDGDGIPDFAAVTNRMLATTFVHCYSGRSGAVLIELEIPPEPMEPVFCVVRHWRR
jgi:hypothetical protein